MSKIKKILVLNENFEVNEASSGIVNSHFVNCLSQNHEVTCLHQTRNFDEVPWIDNVKLVKVEIDDMYTYEKYVKLVPKVRALPSYLTGFSFLEQRKIKSWERAIKNILQHEEFDLIYVLGAGIEFVQHFAMLRIETIIPWIVHIHDPFPMSHYPMPYKKEENMIYRRKADAMERVFQKADAISFPSLRLKEWMEQFHPVIADKYLIVPHLDSRLQNLPTAEEDKLVHLDQDKFNLLHIGSLLGPRDPYALLEAFILFISEDDEKKEKARLHIVGKVTREHQDLKKKSDVYGENVNVITKRVSYVHSVALQREADVLVLLEAAVKESPFMPGKLTDYIMAEKPILALTSRYSETARLLGDNYPYRTESDNVEEIYQMLNTLWDAYKNDTVSYPSAGLKSYVSCKTLEKTLKKWKEREEYYG